LPFACDLTPLTAWCNSRRASGFGEEQFFAGTIDQTVRYIEQGAVRALADANGMALAVQERGLLG
jgi:hypothetical protein